MPKLKAYVRLWSAACLCGAAWHCSAGGTAGSSADLGGDGAGSTSGSGASNGVPPVMGRNDPGFLLDDDSQAVDANGNPVNIGTEVACDGVDENNNGVVDDVDKGKDGL